jgi:hypothetical protein
MPGTVGFSMGFGSAQTAHRATARRAASGTGKLAISASVTGLVGNLARSAPTCAGDREVSRATISVNVSAQYRPWQGPMPQRV